MSTFLVVLGILASVLSTECGPSMHNPHYCYATDPIRAMTYTHAAITSYEAVRHFNFTTVNPYVSDCTPTKFWYVGRYGSCLPNAKGTQGMLDFAESSIIDDIVSNYEAGRTSLCREDYEAIRNFSVESEFGDFFRVENSLMLTESGELAMENIARRFQQAFPTILNETYSPARYHFRHNRYERTNGSIRAFATGLFGDVGAENVFYEPVPETDWLLRPFDHCPAFHEETADFNDEDLAFREGPEIQEMIQQVNEKLGLQGSQQLNVDQIWDMWNWCRFKLGTAFETSDPETGPTSPWCAPFSASNTLAMQYLMEFYFYYLSGYGVRNQRLLQNLNCGVMQDMLIQHVNDKFGDLFFYVFYFSELMPLWADLIAKCYFRHTLAYTKFMTNGES